MPGFESVLHYGLLAPAGTSPNTVDRIAKEVGRLVKDPASAERLEQNGVDLLGNTPREFAAMIAEDAIFWGEALTAAGLRAK